MADEQSADFFAPMEDEQTGAFFQPMEESGGDATIILGAPTETPEFAAPSDDYIGEIDAAPPAVLVPEPATDAPIILGGEAPVEDVADEGKEPSPMAKWNNEWQVTLKGRKDEENAAKGSAVEQAQADLAAFQAEREARREAKMAKNRSDEQDKLEAIEADLENDNSWQRVVKMVELSHDSAEGSSDCGRMRDVLISLKNDTERAAILA